MVQNFDDPTIMNQDLSIFAVPADNLTAIFRYIGLGTSDSLTNPLGDINVINNPSPSAAGQFIRIGTYRSAPDLAELSIIERISSVRPSLGVQMSELLCKWHIILMHSCEGRRDSISNWDTMFHVLWAQASEVDYGATSAFDEAPPIEITTSISFLSLEQIFPIKLGEKADDILLSEVLDVIFADQQSCGSCAPFSNGRTKKFALTEANSASVGLSGQIVFTENGTDFNTDDINSLGGNSGTSLQAAGDYLFVTQETPIEQHHYAKISSILNNPSGANWTAVATGYESGGGGRCSVAVTPDRVFVGGAGGYVYLSTNIKQGVSVIEDASLTTENMNAIAYVNGALLVVGDNNTVLLSTNALALSPSNISFTLITGPAVGVDLTACWIRSANVLEVGTEDGRYFQSYNGGDTWVQIGLPNQGNLSVINDIVYSPDNPLVGIICGQTVSQGFLYRTVTGGRDWEYIKPSIEQLGTAPEKYNAAALCGSNDTFAGGKKSGSTDGILVVGAA